MQSQNLVEPGAARAHRAARDAGAMIRAWRARRRLSQLALALDAGVSARHLSFVETGRSRPSAEMLLALAERLDIPLRARNELLLAAGYAPRFSETRLSSPDLASVRSALQRLLDAHDPYPGVALDRDWNVVLANAAALRLAATLPDSLRGPPLNMFRASLHPQGFAAMTVNFDDWGRYLLGELERLAADGPGGSEAALLEEVMSYPNVRALRGGRDRPADREDRLLIPCVLEFAGTRLSLFTTLATFGSPRDVTLAELTVELFYPADAATEAALRGAG